MGNRLFSIVLACSVFSFADSVPVSSSAATAVASSAAAVASVAKPAADSAAPAAFTTSDSLIATVPLDNPYVELEKIPSKEFQNLVTRAERSRLASLDTSLPKNVRDFARAADYFYRESWDSAYLAYDSLRTRDSVLEKSVILRMAHTRFMQKDYAKMREVLALGKKFATDAEFDKAASRMRIEVAMADTSLSDVAHSDSLKVFLDKYPKGEDAAILKYRYAQYQEQFKQLVQAKKLYMQLLASSTVYKDSAFAAIRRLRKVQGAPESLPEKIAYARMACAKDEASACLSLLDSIAILDSIALAKNPSAAVPAPEDSLQKLLRPSTLDMDTRIALWEKRAVTLRNLKRDDESIAQFRFLLDSVEAKPLWMQSILKLYRNNAKKYAQEIKTTDSLLQDVSQFSKENANNLWIKGFEYEQNQKYDSAIVCFKKLSHRRFKNNVKRQWAKFRIGFVYFKQEKWEEAVAAFIDAAKEPFLWSGSGARMFLGDAYMKLGKDSLAREAYLDCIRDFPLAYYAHRSRLKLAEYKLMDEKDIPYAHGVPMSPEETLAWIRASQKLGKPDTTYNPARYQRIKDLFLYGFSDQAFALYDEVRRKNFKRLDFLYEYGKLFYDVGEVASGYRLARQFQNNMDRRRFMAPPIDVLHYLYPIPFKDQVKYHSGFRIDPFFVYSVMRQESIFNFEIASPVGARGLLQIMPATGKMVAAKEGIPNFDPDLLYNPYMNIRLGVRYLVDLKAEYNDDYMYVLGNYNAGPKPTKRWQKEGEGKHWDIRAEEISYWETRDYVKRVMGNYWIYQEIYEGL
jgi:soluble lytic murein transglycosylase